MKSIQSSAETLRVRSFSSIKYLYLVNLENRSFRSTILFPFPIPHSLTATLTRSLTTMLRKREASPEGEPPNNKTKTMNFKLDAV